MQGLRKRLVDVCAEYRAIGPTARLLYQKEQPKESTKQLNDLCKWKVEPPLWIPPSPIFWENGLNNRDLSLLTDSDAEQKF
nr:protein FAM91A1-like [Ipomoea batatas]